MSTKCPVRVNRDISSAESPRPLHPDERTCPAVIGSSELCRYCCKKIFRIRASILIQDQVPMRIVAIIPAAF